MESGTMFGIIGKLFWCLVLVQILRVESEDTKNSYVGSLVSTLYVQGFDVTPDACLKDVRILVIVNSENSQRELRDAARFTWATFGMSRDVKVVFLLGHSKEDSIPDNVLEESRLYGDIAVSKNVDSFDNLTLKTVAATEWASRWCPHAKFVVKIDSDVFLNFPRLLKLLELDSVKSATKTMFGHVLQDTSPNRDENNKYYISKDVFPEDKYPPYLQGGLVLFTGDLSTELFPKALEMSFFKMQDLFLTAFLRNKVGASITDVQNILVEKWWQGHMWDDKAYICDLKTKVGVHPAAYEDMFDMWIMAFDRKAAC